MTRRAGAIRSGLVVDIGEIPVRLHAPDERYALAMAELLVGLGASTADPVCTLTFGVTGPAPPSRPADDELIDGYAWQDGAEFAVQHESGLVAVADWTNAFISGDAAQLRMPFRRLFLPTIAHLLARHQRFVVHAAAIADDHGALLLLGYSGQGKSTAAAAALMAGQRVLADDLVVVAPRADSAHDVIGLPRPMAVPQDVSDALGDDVLIPRDPRARVELPPDRLSAEATPLRAVVMVDHARAEATLEAVVPSAALASVLSAFTATRNAILLRTFFPHALAMSRLPAWRLRHARRAESRLDEASALLADIQASARADPL